MIRNINVRKFFIYFLSFSIINILLTYYLNKNITGTIKFIEDFWLGIILLIILLGIIIIPNLQNPKPKGIISLLLVLVIFFIQLWYVGILEELLKYQNKIYEFFSKITEGKEVLGITILILLISFINSYNWNKGKGSKSKLIPEREDDLERLEKELDSDIKSILIEENWGEGKTFFINKFREKYKNEYDFIYIKANLLNNHLEFRKRLINELSKILRKNGLLDIRLKDILKYANIEFKGITLKELDEFYDIVLSELNVVDSESIKQIILILDDLDRVNSKDKMNDILNFVGEVNYDLGNSLKLIVLGSKDKIIKILEFENDTGENYLNKYLSKLFYLKEIGFEARLNFFIESENLSENKKKYINQYIKTGLFKDQVIKRDMLIANSNFSMRNIEKFVKELKEKSFTGVKEEVYFKAFFYLKYFNSFYPEYIEYLYNMKTELLSDAEKANYGINRFFEGKKSEEYVFLNKILNKSTNFFISLLCESYGITNKQVQFVEELEEKALDSANKDELEYEDYQKIYNYFGPNYSIEEKIILLEKLVENKKITKFETIKLINLFRIKLNIFYKNLKKFKNEMQNREKQITDEKIEFGELYSEIIDFIQINFVFSIKGRKRNNDRYYEIIKNPKEIQANPGNKLKEAVIESFKARGIEPKDEKNLKLIVEELVDILLPLLELKDETEENSKYNLEQFIREIKEILDRGIQSNESPKEYIDNIDSVMEKFEYLFPNDKEIKIARKKLNEKTQEIVKEYSTKSEYYNEVYQFWLSRNEKIIVNEEIPNV